jgi:hypothetical protein
VPRFYFDLIEDGDLSPDDTGIVLDSSDAAQRQAQRSLAEMVKDALPDGEAKAMALQIRDEGGQTHLTVAIRMRVIQGGGTGQ